MSIIENIKTYFNKKRDNETTGTAPERNLSELVGENNNGMMNFYEVVKGSKNEKRDDTYNNFINKIVETNISGITINKRHLHLQNVSS